MTRYKQSFEMIRKNMGDMIEVYRCKDCGTVFFVNLATGEDIDHVICPICSERSDCGCKTWYDKEDQLDPVIRAKIHYYEQWQYIVDRDTQYKEITGKSPYDIFKKEIFIGKHKFTINARYDCLTKEKSYGRRLILRHSIRYKDSDFYYVKSTIRIPLCRELLSRYFEHSGEYDLLKKEDN